jgi:hypothetical protein
VVCVLRYRVRCVCGIMSVWAWFGVGRGRVWRAALRWTGGVRNMLGCVGDVGGSGCVGAVGGDVKWCWVFVVCECYRAGFG